MDDWSFVFASIISIPFLEEEAAGNWNRRFDFVIQRWLRPSTKWICFQGFTSGVYGVFVSLTYFCNGGWMIDRSYSRASFPFHSWRRKLQETGIVDLILSFNDDWDRQQNESVFKMVCYDRLFLIGVENYVLIWIGNGVKLEFGGNAL